MAVQVFSDDVAKEKDADEEKEKDTKCQRTLPMSTKKQSTALKLNNQSS